MGNINVALAGGYWATNMGNAFYDLGVQYLLQAANPEAKIYFTSDRPEYAWNRYNAANANSLCCFEYFQDMNYLVFTGPMLSMMCLKYWEKTLANLNKKGTKIILLSAGSNLYNEEEKKEVSEFLKHHRFYALFSRDEETYLNYREYFDHSYNGICCAFYISDYFNPYSLQIDPYVVFDFETYEEPVFWENDSKWDFEFHDRKYCWDKHLKRIRKRIYKKSYDDMFGEYQIIRTKHSLYQPRNLYEGNHIYLSDVPYDYLNIYANATAVFSDRVHACVAALAQGTPAMLFNPTGRSKLINRVCKDNFNDIYSHPITIDMSYLKQEKEMQIKELRRILV